jgi:hypothetical protein
MMDEQTKGISEDSSENLLTAATIRKTDLEAKLLEEQLSPSYRRRNTITMIAGASGLIIALVTVVGGLLSVYGWFAEQNRTREIRIEERMERALNLLSEKRASQRTAAISALHSFLTASNANRNSQVLISIANALPLEDSGVVRNAMLSFFEDIDTEIVGKPAMDAALKSLVYNSRGLVLVSDLWRKRPENLYWIENDVKEGAALQALARAMAVLLRKGAQSKDLSRTYLGRSDLSGVNLMGLTSITAF